VCRKSNTGAKVSAVGKVVAVRPSQVQPFSALTGAAASSNSRLEEADLAYAFNNASMAVSSLSIIPEPCPRGLQPEYTET